MPSPYNHHAFRERMARLAQERGLASPWDFVRLEPGPWAPIKKPLVESTIAIVSSAGIHLHSQEPFETLQRADLVFYEVPTTVDPSELAISHRSYDHSDADKDVNCVFPYQRLREFAAEGIIGALSPRAYTCMGRIPNGQAVERTLAPQIAQRVQADAVDLVLLTAG